MAGLWAFIVFSRRRYKWAILLPVFFFVTGAFIAFLSGSLVGKEKLTPSRSALAPPWTMDHGWQSRNGTGRDRERKREAVDLKEEYEEAVGTI